MRVRALSPTGDYTFGRGQLNFLVNSAACVGQCVETALELMQGEWFLDNTKGTPYGAQILGFGTTGLYDGAIQQVILGVENVLQISNYSSSLDTVTRELSVAALVQTPFGPVQVSAVVGQATVPPVPLGFAGSEVLGVVTFTWEQVPGTTYQLYRGMLPYGVVPIPVAVGLTGSSAVVDLSGVGSYYFQLRANVGGILSEPTYAIEVQVSPVNGALQFNFTINSAWAALVTGKI